MIRILHTNDFHGMLRGEVLAGLLALRETCDLYFDCGDAIRAGNLAIPLKREAAWNALEELRCDASVLGNRETHPLEAAFRKKLQGASHPVLCANLHDKDGQYPLARSVILERSGFRIGVFGVMVAMVTEKMATQAASRYLWDAPIPVALAMAEELRPQADLVVALTHIGFAQDRKLAEAGPKVDLILGGHSHTVLEEPAVVSGIPILQTGSHGRFAGIYEWDGELRSARLVPLRAENPA